MTPSEAHESAWQRDSSHDEMTIACRDILERTWLTTTHIEYQKTELYNRDIIDVEHFFHSSSGPRFFADIMIRFYRNRERASRSRFRHAVFEIKPKIYSAGALLRQIKVQEERMKAWIASDSNAYGDSAFVEAIVRRDDPMIDIYTRLSRKPVIAWDGANTIEKYYHHERPE